MLPPPRCAAHHHRERGSAPSPGLRDPGSVPPRDVTLAAGTRPPTLPVQHPACGRGIQGMNRDVDYEMVGGGGEQRRAVGVYRWYRPKCGRIMRRASSLWGVAWGGDYSWHHALMLQTAPPLCPPPFPSQSMFHADRSSRTMSEQMAALWQHECARVFQDRIADPPTRDWFNKTLHQVGLLRLGGSIDLALCSRIPGLSHPGLVQQDAASGQAGRHVLIKWGRFQHRYIDPAA